MHHASSRMINYSIKNLLEHSAQWDLGTLNNMGILLRNYLNLFILIVDPMLLQHDPTQLAMTNGVVINSFISIRLSHLCHLIVCHYHL